MKQNTIQTAEKGSEERFFLPSPSLEDLDYLEMSSVPLYANLFQIKLGKRIQLFQYCTIFEETQEENLAENIKRKVIEQISDELINYCGNYFFIGNVIWAEKQAQDFIRKEVKNCKCKCTVLIKPTNNSLDIPSDSKLVYQMYMNGEKEIKTVIELMFKDILKHNPKLKFRRDLYGLKDEDYHADATEDYNNIKIMPGFCTKVLFINNGIYLNIDLKHKITSKYDCLYLITTFYDYEAKKSPSAEEKDEINCYLSDRIVENIETGQRFRVKSVNFEKNPKNTEFIYEGVTTTMYNFYKKMFDIELAQDSPLLEVQSTGEFRYYHPPELCHLVGLTEDMEKDGKLMKNLASHTKQKPRDKAQKIYDISELINDKARIKNSKVSKSAYERKCEYGIDLIDASRKNSFIGKKIKDPKLEGREGFIHSLTKPFKLYRTNRINFLCFYSSQKPMKEMDSLVNYSKSFYGIDIGKPTYKFVKSRKFADWKREIDKTNLSPFNILVFLIDSGLKDDKNFYGKLKKYTAEEIGIATQFICSNNLKKGFAVMTNILIQMNTKVGGFPVKISMPNKMKLMVMGIDTSKKRENGQVKLNIAGCATLDDCFSSYVTLKETKENFPNRDFCLPIDRYIERSLEEYEKKNRCLPGGIVIYRQGVSQEQKERLEKEKKAIERVCSEKNIKFYYVLVNKKTTLKIFTNPAGTGAFEDFSGLDNPNPGLLVFENLVDPMLFEFYLQPQKVTQGCASPTHFHVAFGNLDIPEVVPLLSYNLCYLYSNWKGPVRVPAPLKYAEKSATIPVSKLHSKLQTSLCLI